MPLGRHIGRRGKPAKQPAEIERLFVIKSGCLKAGSEKFADLFVGDVVMPHYVIIDGVACDELFVLYEEWRCFFLPDVPDEGRPAARCGDAFELRTRLFCVEPMECLGGYGHIYRAVR